MFDPSLVYFMPGTSHYQRSIGLLPRYEVTQKSDTKVTHNWPFLTNLDAIEFALGKPLFRAFSLGIKPNVLQVPH